jgi:putative transposase
MARQRRIDFPGATHHVMNRGADHQPTFRNDDDRELFVTLWAQAAVRFGIIVVSYCLMNNHYHFLVRSPKGQLSRTLQFIARSYTQQFNHHHERDGALFRGRFHSILVDSDTYFGRVSRYIELNPAAAGMVALNELQSYRWSSFQYYSGKHPTPPWLSTDLVLNSYTDPAQYCRFVQSGMTDNELERFYRRQLQPGLVLGRESFVEGIKNARPEECESLRPGIPELSIEDIDATIIALTGSSTDVLMTSIRGRRNIERSAAVEMAQLLTGASLAELASHYKFPSVQAVSNAIGRARANVEGPAFELRSVALRSLGRTQAGHRIGA